MTLLFFDGFTQGNAVITRWKPQWNIITHTLSTNNGRISGNCMQIASSNDQRLSLPSAAATAYVGFAINDLGNNSGFAFRFKSDADATDQITITFGDSTGLIEVRRGNASGTLLASVTYSAGWVFGRWTHFQIKCFCDDTTGNVVIKKDGVEIINFTGDTRNGGTSPSIDTIRINGINQFNMLMDDLWICDGVDATATQGRPNNTFLGDLSVKRHDPNADGAVVSDWSVTGAASHYQAVNDAVNSENTTTYINVSNASLPKRDLVNVQDYSGTITTVYGIQQSILAQKSDAGLANIQPIIRESGGTVTAGPSTPLSVSWDRLWGPFYWVKPSDSTVFTTSDINGIQIGVDAVT